MHMTAEMRGQNTIYSMQTDGGLANKLKKTTKKSSFLYFSLIKILSQL